ncbi:uncharacterized protein LY89DRAFT_675455 [Mollisia scopiformis]|uniref:Uncharacterized protein n=1 Tax=Mollisia scopiformis TaxID=149040 RepID=A0A132BC52_MOLSC|nr:uncharacterized protein LY89DRAFT_675455 [Mollisia scopiformis]KUJ09948.1 hypothetical protein LY89DRAFT_675455 [Mollisia scopiformis]
MIHTSVEIAAPPDQVKNVKDDVISGTMGGVNFTAKIIECNANTLSWTGPPVYGLFRGIHVFRFEKSTVTGGGTTFVQEESFVGIMAWAFSPVLPLGWVTKSYFNKFNAELKGEAEARYTHS